MVALPLLMLLLSPFSQAQLWKPILSPGQAIDWSNAGVGGTPARNTKCAIVSPPATFTEINTALASCPAGDAVYLAAGTYSITGTIRVPSNVTLRGAGASLTILNATGGNGGDVISLGSGSVSYNRVNITRVAAAGSTSIVVDNASNISVADYLAITEANEGGRGQIVEVKGVNGTAITISPGLYSTYKNTTVAIPFSMSEGYAGVENLQVHANNSGYAANFGISRCAYCWIKGVESNDSEGDNVEVDWGYHDEIRDSYFSNVFPHAPGARDSDIHIALNTTASLVENNIVGLGSLTLDSGAAGNVVSYNYWAGESDSNSTDAAIGGIDLRGEHLQFNLLEGNVLSTMYSDPVSFASGKTTAYRNWVNSAYLICSSINGHDTVNCMDPKSPYGIQATRTAENSHPGAGPNLVGNVVGIAQRQFPAGGSSLLVEKASAEYPPRRDDGAGVHGSSSDYLEVRDDGANIQAEGVSQTLPATFYLSGRPSWWGSMPFPATGPDVTGGFGPEGHSYGNPAQACYFRAMGGSDEAARRPLAFDAGKCYGTAHPAPKAPAGLTANAHRAGP
jgi:hypothetical protein